MNAFTQPVKPTWLRDLNNDAIKRRGGSVSAKKAKGQVVYGLNNKPENNPNEAIDATSRTPSR